MKQKDKQQKETERTVDPRYKEFANDEYPLLTLTTEDAQNVATYTIGRELTPYELYRLSNYLSGPLGDFGCPFYGELQSEIKSSFKPDYISHSYEEDVRKLHEELKKHRERNPEPDDNIPF